jgi:energy-coupling factor transport system permease protein
VLAGLVGVCVGGYGLLDASTPGYLGTPMLAGGLAAATGGLFLGGRLVRRSVYRPDRWRAPELAVAGCGLAAAAGIALATRLDPAGLYPPTSPLAWPALAALPVAAILVAGLPAVVAPPAPVVRSGVPA